MRLYARFSVLALVPVLAALMTPPKCSAQFVSISASKVDQCGRGFVFCNGRQAYSLSEIENGSLQIPIFPFLPSEVVIVNDTGATLTDLQFTLTTLRLLDSFVQCQIAPSARSLLKDCTAANLNSGFSSNPFSLVSVQFDYTADNKKGIVNGAYFDITTVGFISGSYIGGGNGGSTGSGGDGGTGTASY
jgi:hypothetical protein